jgi:hypothetical protein
MLTAEMTENKTRKPSKAVLEAHRQLVAAVQTRLAGRQPEADGSAKVYLAVDEKPYVPKRMYQLIVGALRDGRHFVSGINTPPGEYSTDLQHFDLPHSPRAVNPRTIFDTSNFTPEGLTRLATEIKAARRIEFPEYHRNLINRNYPPGNALTGPLEVDLDI